MLLCRYRHGGTYILNAKIKVVILHPKRRLFNKRGIGIKILNKKPLVMLLHFLVVEEGLCEPFHARDWLKTYAQGPRENYNKQANALTARDILSHVSANVKAGAPNKGLRTI